MNNRRVQTKNEKKKIEKQKVTITYRMYEELT